jgi:hypothetical protein
MTAYIFDERLLSASPSLLSAIIHYAESKKVEKPIMHDFSLSQALLSKMGSGADCAEYYSVKEKFEFLFEIDKTNPPDPTPEDMKDRIVIQLANAYVKSKTEAVIVSDKNYSGMRLPPINGNPTNLDETIQVITFEDFAKRKQLQV